MDILSSQRTESGSIQVHLEREGTGFPCIWNHHSGKPRLEQRLADDDTLYAYVLAHEKFPGKTFLAFICFSRCCFNGGLVPTYIMYTRYLHENTIPALIIPGLLMSAFNVILTERIYSVKCTGGIKLRAAKIDGATEFQVFHKVVLPYVSNRSLQRSDYLPDLVIGMTGRMDYTILQILTNSAFSSF